MGRVNYDRDSVGASSLGLPKYRPVGSRRFHWMLTEAKEGGEERQGRNGLVQRFGLLQLAGVHVFNQVSSPERLSLLHWARLI